MSKINKEKKKILQKEGNILVKANPGTGKTTLLSHKYVNLIKDGTKAEDILCLTFTEKAKKGMEKEILKVLEENNERIDLSNLNIYTFHSFALDNIDENEILSTNLLRFTIFNYLKENEVLNYSNNYLINTIVPKIENLIRYLKSFGILPKDINKEKVKKHIKEDKKYSKKELDIFADEFISIFKSYEKMKNKRGADYADLLIRFLNLRKHPNYKYVLVDELQDVNILEAEIALKSSDKFFAVGDKKQAIFGFQGGSILNFKKFKDSKQFVLSENYRSTDEILDYAANYFKDRTEEDAYIEEVAELKSATGKSGKKPRIYDVPKDKLVTAACKLASNLEGKTAIITRTNYQIMDISRELSARDIDFSSTYFSASENAKEQIIKFLKGILSDELEDMKASMFTPFFPSSIQEAFAVSKEKYMKKEEFMKRLPAFKKLKDNIKTMEDVNILFRKVILPISLSYGIEYVSAAKTMQDSYNEAMNVLDNKDMTTFMAYLKSTDLLSVESDIERDIILSTVHKAKGRQFDNVIYIPSRTSNRSNFVDNIVEAILASKGINVEEEIEEETLRINFVAFTRAKNELIILTSKIKDYLNEYAENKDIETDEIRCNKFDQSKNKAFSLFVNGDFEKSKKVLYTDENWIKKFITQKLKSIDHISFSSLKRKAYDYFINSMLNVSNFSAATSLGSDVHGVAEKICSEKDYNTTEETKPYVENVKKMIEDIKEDYPTTVETEKGFKISLSKLGFNSDILFKGFIDVIFKNSDGEYLIIDWKTNRNTNYASKHRRQLAAYKQAYSKLHDIDPDNIKVGIGYAGLRSTINTGKIGYKLDLKQPSKSSIKTFSKYVNKLLSWIDNPEEFLNKIMEEEVNEPLWERLVEEIQR